MQEISIEQAHRLNITHTKDGIITQWEIDPSSGVYYITYADGSVHAMEPQETIRL